LFVFDIISTEILDKRWPILSADQFEYNINLHSLQLRLLPESPERERERDASLNTNEAPRCAHAHSLQPHWRAAVEVTIYSLTPH